MKHVVRWSVVLMLAATAACGKGDKGDGGGGGAAGGGGGGAKPGVDPANCDKVANTMSAARAKTFNVGGKLPQFASAVADACRANAWPEPVRACLVAAKDDASSKACVDNAADAAAKTKIVEDVNKALSAQGSTATW